MTLVGQKTYSVEEIRKTYSKAYAPWTEEEDKLLKSAYEEFTKLNQPEESFILEYAKKFGRKHGGIRSRIVKLSNGEITYKQGFSSSKNPQPITKTHHPEFTSTPRDGHPLFREFILAARKYHESKAPGKDAR